MTEKVTYAPHPDDPSQSVASRKAWIDSQMFGLRRPIEAFGIERFKSNCTKAVLGFNHILQILFPSKLLLTADSNKNVSQFSRIDETKEKLREKAKKAGVIAGNIALVSSTKANVEV